MHLLPIWLIFTPAISYQKNVAASGREQPVLESVAWTPFPHAGQQTPCLSVTSSLHSLLTLRRAKLL